MKTITIRPYKSSDLQTIIQLFKEAVAAINIRHYSPEQIAIWTEIDPARWQTKFANHIVFVAVLRDASNDAPPSLRQEASADRQDERIVGFAAMSREGEFGHLYVHKDYQAQLVSLRLFRAIEKAARELGLSKIFTNCSITAKIPAKRMGFVVIKEQTVEKKRMKFINYYMEKKLV
jgi:putative acetyltransferase